MKNEKMLIYALFFILFFLTIYEYYIYKKLAIKISNVEMQLSYQREFENAKKTFSFFNSFANGSGLIASELKVLPSGKEFIFIYKFESKELFDNFIIDKGKSEFFKIWEESLNKCNVEKVKIIDKDDNIIKIVRKGEYF